MPNRPWLSSPVDSSRPQFIYASKSLKHIFGVLHMHHRRRRRYRVVNHRQRAF